MALGALVAGETFTPTQAVGLVLVPTALIAGQNFAQWTRMPSAPRAEEIRTDELVRR